MHHHLTSTQKWQLALRLLVFFSPLLFYVNLPEALRGWEGMRKLLPFALFFLLVNLGLYYIWIGLTDWCQRVLVRWFGEEFLMRFSAASLLVTLLVSLLLSFLFTLALYLVVSGTFHVVHFINPSPRPKALPFTPEVLNYVGRANSVFSVVIMLSAFYLIINVRAFQQLKEVQLKAERLEKEALLSQFDALKQQLSPHFLFNSLSILTSLIHEDVDLSEQFIKRLSKAYRYILEQREQDLVPLKTELDFIESYTFLLQIRFEHKFEVLVDVPPERQLQNRIAPLTLQLLVENAVKHNRMSLQERLRVRIYTEGDWLLVENPIQAREQPAPSTGIGLQNIANRYALLTERPVSYGPEAECFVVKIPLLTQ